MPKYSILKAAILCVGPVHISAQTIENQALAILIDEIQRAGYVEISVAERLFGGFVVEAKLDDIFTVFSIDAESQDIGFTQSFSRDAETGFFARATSSLEQTARDIVSRYESRVLSSEAGASAASVDLPAFAKVNPGPGFQQERRLTSSEGIVALEQFETLGVLDREAGADQQILSIEQRSTTGGRISANQSGSFSVQESSRVFRIQGLIGFDAENFENPADFRATIEPRITVVSDVPYNLSDQIRQQVVTGSQTVVRQFPSLFEGGGSIESRIEHHLKPD